jgi:hypothetical protein
MAVFEVGQRLRGHAVAEHKEVEAGGVGREGIAGRIGWPEAG